MCKVPGTDGGLEFHEWKRVKPQGKPLTQVWLRFSGAPSKPMQDARVVASFGILVGRPERVDMNFTRAQPDCWLVFWILSTCLRWSSGHIEARFITS